MSSNELGNTRSNESAVRAFLALNGGFEAYVVGGGKMLDLAPLLDANPDDDLSGLRSMGERMDYSQAPARQHDEPLIEPAVAKEWILRTGRAIEFEGELSLAEDCDHLGIAGLAIATGQEPRFLSEAYYDLPSRSTQLSQEAVATRAWNIAEKYRVEPDA